MFTMVFISEDQDQENLVKDFLIMFITIQRQLHFKPIMEKIAKKSIPI